MQIVAGIYQWFDIVVAVMLLALQVWAIADCATRKAAAFPAVDRLTKPVWLGILAIAAAITILSVGIFLSMIATVAALVYLVDVRPAIREITGGP